MSETPGDTPAPAAVQVIGQFSVTADLTVTSAAEEAADQEGNVADG